MSQKSPTSNSNNSPQRLLGTETPQLNGAAASGLDPLQLITPKTLYL
jgi:hypothetical protein